MFKSTSVTTLAEPAEPSLDERLAEAAALGGYARSQYLQSALALDEAANDLDIIAQDAQNEIDSLVDIFEAAIRGSDLNRASAKRIRALVEETSDLTLF